MSDQRIFRENFSDAEGKLVYGPDHVIESGPYAWPGNGTFVELEDGWYRLRKVDVTSEPPLGRVWVSKPQEGC